MLRKNPTGKREVIQNKQRSDSTIVAIDGIIDDSDYIVPGDWPFISGAVRQEFKDSQIYAVINTYGDPPHLLAAIHSVFDHVDGFIILHGCSWSGRSEENKVLDILKDFDWKSKQVFITDVSEKYRGKEGQLAQRTHAFRFMNDGDWYWILDDDEVWDDENAKKMSDFLRSTREIAVSVTARAYWQKIGLIGWSEQVCRAVRKLKGSHFVGVSQCADSQNAQYVQAKRPDIFYHHLSYINSDKAIEEKIADYQRRAAVGDFKELRKNYMDLWYEQRKTGPTIGMNVHPIPGYPSNGLSKTPAGSLPAALKYSKFGVTAESVFTVSIVVVTYNSGHCLMDMLRSLVQFKTGYNTEVILVDNLSKDAAYLKRAETFLQDNGVKVATLLLHENHMFTKAANYGMENVSGFWRLLVNPDVKFIHDGWFQKLVDASNDLNAGIIAPKMIYENGTIHFGGGRKAHDKYFHIARDEKDVGQADTPMLTEWVTGACFLIRLDVYLALGGLDEQYKHYASDNKYCELARRSGFNVAYAGKQSTIIHLCGKSCK